MTHTMKTTRLLQQGMASILGLLFLSVVVIFILMKSLNMSGTKSLETQQHLDSIAALALAESGREMAAAAITTAVNGNDAAFQTSCNNFASGTTTVGTSQSFTYKTPSTASTTTLCPVRVQGTSGTANRTIESWFNMKTVIGTGGYGTTASMSLKNNSGSPAVAIFNLAWRISGSTGQNPPNTPPNASGSNCSGCFAAWNLASTQGGGSNAVGSMGTAIANVPDGSDAVVSPQTLDAPRNFAEVGLILGGVFSTPPSIVGCYQDQQGTANTSSGSSSVSGSILGPKANSTCGLPNTNWCDGADTIVFGVSGRGNDDVRASFSTLTLNGTPITTEPITVPSWMAHYPNTDGTSPPIMKGDVFSEIWYRYNKRITDMNVKSVTTAGNTTTITVQGAVALDSSMIIQVNKNNAGYFVPYTKPTFVRASVPPGDTVFDVPSAAVSSPINNNATICTGICALFNNPWDSSKNNTTSFTLTHDNFFVSQQWAGGFVCLSGVDPSKVRRISSSSLKVQKWHEVVSGE